MYVNMELNNFIIYLCFKCTSKLLQSVSMFTLVCLQCLLLFSRLVWTLDSFTICLFNDKLQLHFFFSAVFKNKKHFDCIAGAVKSCFKS